MKYAQVELQNYDDKNKFTVCWIELKNNIKKKSIISLKNDNQRWIIKNMYGTKDSEEIKQKQKHDKSFGPSIKNNNKGN